MSRNLPERVGDIRAAVRMMGTLDFKSGDPARRIDRKRRLVADLCRMLDPQPRFHGPGHPGEDGGESGLPATPFPGRSFPGGEAARIAGGLSPRLRQTLDRLLAGDSEKEIAARFGRSRHTVHVYVKRLYQRFDVCSRGELLARFVPGLSPTPPSSRGGAT